MVWSSMHSNLDDFDRIVRGIAGIWLFFIAISAFRARRRATAAIAGIAALGLLQNSLTGYCGGNRVLSLDTT